MSVPTPVVPPDPMPDLVDGIEDLATVLAAAAVRDFCGWHIAPVIEQTLTLRGPALLLPTMKLLNVSAASNDGTAVTVTEWDEVGVVLCPQWCGWSSKMRSVSVTFTHGYETCPEALAGAVASMASRGVTSLGVTRSQVGQVSRVYSAGASDGALGGTEAELAIVRRYRIPQSS